MFQDGLEYRVRFRDWAVGCTVRQRNCGACLGRGKGFIILLIIIIIIIIVAVQDQAISTNYIKNKILKEETD